MNRCVGNCVFSFGPDNAVANTSPVFNGTTTLTEYAYDDASFDAVVACITDLLAPFDAQVTTVDPSPTPHYEIVVAGTPQQAGLPVGSAGVASATCARIPNAPMFVFANANGDIPQLNCEVAGFQLGSVAGLEPLYNCADAMYLYAGCGNKTFRNELSPCGTNAPATCQCGGTTRNSFAVVAQALRDVLLASGFE